MFVSAGKIGGEQNFMRDKPEKYFIDTNVLVYAHDIQDARKQSKAQKVIFDGLRLGTAVISTQVLIEFFVTITQKIEKPLSVVKAKKEIILLSNLEIIEVDAPMITRAIDIKKKWRLSYWDSLILSAAERGQCSKLYSEDFSDGRNYDSVRVCNIFSSRQP